MGNCLGLCEPFASPDRLRALRHSPAIKIDVADARNGRSVKLHHHQNLNRRRGASKAGIAVPLTVLEEATDDVKLLYDLGPELGRGQFGVIRFCTNKRTGENFACKSIAKGRLCRQKDVNDVRREIQIMKLLVGHPNIVELKDVYEDHTWVHLIMELCEGGELFDSIIHKKAYSEKEAAAICKTLMEALAYCHKHGVIHRDLKPENILLSKNSDQTNVIKLADFGLAVNIRPGEKICGMAGSAYYIAPEVLKGDYGEEVDIWSAGVVLYILLSGLPPFWGETEEAIFNAIKFGHLDLSSDPWPKVSAAAKDLIKGMLRQEIKKRLTPEQVLNHRWIVENTQTNDAEGLVANLRVDTVASGSWMTETNSFASFYSESEVRDSENYILSASSSQAYALDASSRSHPPLSKSAGFSMRSHRPQSRSCTTDAGDVKLTASLRHISSLPETMQNDRSQVCLNVLSPSTPQHRFSESAASMKDLKLLCSFARPLAPRHKCCSCTLIEASQTQRTILVDSNKESYFTIHDFENLPLCCKLMDDMEPSSIPGTGPSDRPSWSPYSLDGYVQTQLQVAC